MTGRERLLRVAVLASGTGRSFENLVRRSRDEGLPFEVVLLLGDRAGAAVFERAARLGVPSSLVEPRSFPDGEAFGAAVAKRLDEHGADVAVLAGFLRRLPLVDRWRGRILNIHPALLPSFGGRGFYGHRVHEAVLAAGVKVSGCTVHFVDDAYDSGPIVLQKVVPVRFEDDVETLAARVFEQEKKALPEALTLYAQRRLEIVGRRVRVLAEEEG